MRRHGTLLAVLVCLVAATAFAADWLKGSKNEVGVSDGVRTRDFRSHSPALYH